MENLNQNEDQLDAGKALEFDSILREEYGTDIIDFMELEDDIEDVFSSLSLMADGIDLAADNIDTGFNGFESGGCVADSSQW
jgi:hypothetical protein